MPVKLADLVLILLPPVLHHQENGLQAETEGRQAVLHLRRHFRVDLAVDNPVPLELAELTREHPLRDVREQTSELVEAPRPVQKAMQHHPLPLSSEYIERGLYRTRECAMLVRHDSSL